MNSWKEAIKWNWSFWLFPYGSKQHIITTLQDFSFHFNCKIYIKKCDVFQCIFVLYCVAWKLSLIYWNSFLQQIIGNSYLVVSNFLNASKSHTKLRCAILNSLIEICPIHHLLFWSIFYLNNYNRSEFFRRVASIKELWCE